MKAVAGALVILAGAILFAGGAVGWSLVQAHGQSRDDAAMLSMAIGFLTGLIGLGVLFIGLASRDRD